ncbi:MAG: hypothetical protein ACJ8BW_13150, partial [Ktedonobacteraceae bacterium]
LPLSVSPATIACTPHVPLASAHRVDLPFHDKLTIGDVAYTAGTPAFLSALSWPEKNRQRDEEPYAPGRGFLLTNGSRRIATSSLRHQAVLL